MNVAIVHDYLNQMGGAERVVAALHEIFPEAPIFTSIVDRDVLWPELASADIRPSWMQNLPGLKKHFKKYVPFYPWAIESLPLREYDLLISSSSAFAKGAMKGPKALHICYCYTPMRFVWDYKNYVEKEDLNALTLRILPVLIAYLRHWDMKTKERPDYYIAISSVVRERVKKVYGVNAEVIFPPVDIKKFRIQTHVDNFYLIVSRLNAYKKIDLAVEAFNLLGLPLKIIGSGPFLKTLKRMARPNISFLGRLDDKEVADYYALCKALIFPGEEDFGIVPLEANAAGRPVIAFHGGGALDTVVEGLNGLFFLEGRAESLVEAVKSFENGKYDFQPMSIRAHASCFDKEVFKNRIKKYVSDKYTEFQLRRP
ncbi:MAG: glycosyltransferase [Acidobacteria bacterium]|nr:glycosyltransferase [Acidobacteriota bacterium]